MKEKLNIKCPTCGHMHPKGEWLTKCCKYEVFIHSEIDKEKVICLKCSKLTVLIFKKKRFKWSKKK